MRLAPLALTLLLSAPTFAQVPDTTAAWRYFPLEVGNVWEYEYDYLAVGSRTRYLRTAVEADSLIEGERYHVLRNDRFDADRQPQPGNPVLQFVRFDTTRAMVVMRAAGGEEPWLPITPLLDVFSYMELLSQPCPYDADFEAPVACDGTEGWVTGGYGLPTGLGDFHTAIKRFGTACICSHTYALAADLGPLQDHGSEAGFETQRFLRYARVGGVEYGQPLALASEPTTPEARLALSVYPNPSRGAATLALTVPAPQTVTVEVFDVLGRRVYHEAHVVSGATTLSLDGRVWKPGVYVVRATMASGAITATRLTKK